SLHMRPHESHGKNISPLRVRLVEAKLKSGPEHIYVPTQRPTRKFHGSRIRPAAARKIRIVHGAVSKGRCYFTRTKSVEAGADGRSETIIRLRHDRLKIRLRRRVDRRRFGIRELIGKPHARKPVEYSQRIA